MKKKIVFFLRNVAKNFIQQWILPAAYELERLRYRGEKTLYVFADAHHTSLPFSLQAMHDRVRRLGIEPVCHFYDYTHEGAVRSLIHAIQFMKLRARAKYIFICDTFLPVSSGRRDPETAIVQLCHFSGPFKKIGYATEDDVPAYYKGNVFRNYDLVTASSELYVPLLTEAMRQAEGIVQPLGVSRSDVYFDSGWVEGCRTRFYEQYPDAAGKKILLWAPTFRGKAVAPDALDNGRLLRLQEELGEDWLVLIRHHPHDDAVAADPRQRSNCSIPTEQLLPVVDLLITDYSTTVLDYLTFDKPFLLYAPDLDAYEKTRGFFVDYRSITRNLVEDPAKLGETAARVYREWESGDREEIRRCRERFAKACDGHATERILRYLDACSEQK
ncbi:MAG: CDP-glycerol glycerophosphotransferase family protein [Oscillospiraceae bacterium]|nr:CDP-glycerol glycerophosphotransferase family protein [Oscillospiraceae bacterium]